jgi:hypothetical protein
MNNKIENPAEYALFLELRKKYESIYQNLEQIERQKKVIDLETYLMNRSKNGKGTYLTNSDGSFCTTVLNGIEVKFDGMYTNPYSDRTKEEWDELIAFIEVDYGTTYDF